MLADHLLVLRHQPWERDRAQFIAGILFIAVTLVLARTRKPVRLVSDIINTVKQRLRAWAYLFNGPTIIQNAYSQSQGQPFEVYAPDTRIVFVSSPKHIKELDRAPDTVLSLNRAVKQMLQPMYTMNGFNWLDRRGAEGLGFVRTLRTLLTNNLLQILPDLRVLANNHWDKLLDETESVDGTMYAAVYPMMLNLVTLLNARALFGEDLVKDEEFMRSALGYVEETQVSAELIKLSPKFLAPVVGAAIGRYFDSHKRFFQSLIPAAEQRVQERELRKLGRRVPKREDCIQWIIETAPKDNPWSAERVILKLMAIWFGSVHSLSTTVVYVIHDLCLHPEYIPPLRHELQTSYKDFERTCKGLPLLDSFIKESSRLTPTESLSVRRCAMKPFSLSDGTQLAIGDWACVPSAAINLSAEYYPSPNEFSGFRFVDPTYLDAFADCEKPRQHKPSELTDVDDGFLMWGTGRITCPGRFYASAFMKMVVAQLLMNYDFALAEPDAKRWFSWRAAKVPRMETKVMFTRRG